MRVERFAAGATRIDGRRASRGGFRLPEDAPGSVAEADSVDTISHISVLAAQAKAGAAADDHVERRVDGMLDALARLQVALLSETLDRRLLAQLAKLAEGEAAKDPALADLAAGVVLRAQVEIARRQRSQGTHTTEE